MRSRREPEEHDPEREAAAYVQGEMRDRDRRSFEAHLLACERCWKEVHQARTGRALAERGRELGPPGLRDDIRAAVVLSGAPARGGLRVRVSVAAVVVLGLIGTAVFVTGELRGRKPEQPKPIAAALASFRSEQVPSSDPTMHAPPDLRAAGLVLINSGRSSLGGLPVDVFWFTDGKTKVELLLSSRRFPEAVGATERGGTVHGWEMSEDGVGLLCADSPVSYLLMSRDGAVVRRAEAVLRQQSVPPAA
jgi:hypothetical protein